MVIFYHIFKEQCHNGAHQYHYRRTLVQHPVEGNFSNKDITQSSIAQGGYKSNNKNPKNIQFFSIAANAPATLKAAVPTISIILRDSMRWLDF